MKSRGRRLIEPSDHSAGATQDGMAPMALNRGWVRDQPEAVKVKLKNTINLVENVTASKIRSTPDLRE